MKHGRGIVRFLYTFVVYFALCALVVTSSFLLFFSQMEIPEDRIEYAAKSTFVNVILLALVLVVADHIRRKITVDRPVKRIQEALQKIMQGDFSVRLDSRYVHKSFAAIMDNINRMTEELSGVETLRTDFVANVSHEMKTPLAVMQNYGTLLQAPGLSEEKRLEYAKAIADTSRRVADMMTNILKLNRLENQQIYPETTAYDLGEQLCECLLRYEPVWEQKGIDVQTDLSDGVIVHADRELLSLVWNNLFSNAFKFTAEGGSVSVTLSATPHHLVVTVQDTGCGMSPDVGKHIFEKFYQGDTSHATQGNGLGLALVRRVVDILQGEIGVESEVGKGSRFTVRLRKQTDE